MQNSRRLFLIWLLIYIYLIGKGTFQKFRGVTIFEVKPMIFFYQDRHFSINHGYSAKNLQQLENLKIERLCIQSHVYILSADIQ